MNTFILVKFSDNICWIRTLLAFSFCELLFCVTTQSILGWLTFRLIYSHPLNIEFSWTEKMWLLQIGFWYWYSGMLIFWNSFGGIFLFVNDFGMSRIALAYWIWDGNWSWFDKDFNWEGICTFLVEILVSWYLVWCFKKSLVFFKGICTFL